MIITTQPKKEKKKEYELIAVDADALREDTTNEHFKIPQTHHHLLK